ncbi:hypothetical protein [Corallococcus interemptor]|nr:hypothetical protein [Corallococcus interemptor]
MRWHWLLSQAKRARERPEAEQPWPAVAEDAATRQALRDTTARLLASR